jgi:hypothetical protein
MPHSLTHRQRQLLQQFLLVLPLRPQHLMMEMSLQPSLRGQPLSSLTHKVWWRRLQPKLKAQMLLLQASHRLNKLMH